MLKFRIQIPHGSLNSLCFTILAQLHTVLMQNHQIIWQNRLITQILGSVSVIHRPLWNLHMYEYKYKHNNIKHSFLARTKSLFMIAPLTGHITKHIHKSLSKFCVRSFSALKYELCQAEIYWKSSSDTWI